MKILKLVSTWPDEHLQRLFSKNLKFRVRSMCHECSARLSKLQFTCIEENAEIFFEKTTSCKYFRNLSKRTSEFWPKLQSQCQDDSSENFLRKIQFVIFCGLRANFFWTSGGSFLAGLLKLQTARPEIFWNFLGKKIKI